MKLALLGGGGFRVPLLFRTLLADDSERRVTELRLWDSDPQRLAVMSKVLGAMAQGRARAPRVRLAVDLDEAIAGADFVFSAIRVGGVEARAEEERIARACGVLGQETTGFGGLNYALRGIPTALRIAQRIARLAPDARLINFTNPAGVITEVSARILGDKVIGICDSPIGLGRRVLGVLERAGVVEEGTARLVVAGDERVRLDYLGLNHLGWLQRILVDGVDVLPDLLGHPDRVAGFEEGRLFGAEWIGQLGAVPNEYLHYYYFAREAREADHAVPATRGVFLAAQQRDFYERAATLDGPAAFELWEQTRLAREETYMASNRLAAGGIDRAEEDLDSGGYDQVALTVMRALAFDEPAEVVVNVRNHGRIPNLPDDAVIEAPCRIDGHGVRAVPVSPLPKHAVGLVQSVKYAERCAIKAALRARRDLALKAFAHHPLIDGVGVARRLLTEAQHAFPELDYLK